MGAPFVCDVVLLHKPGACTAGHLEECQGEQGLQERCLPVAEGAGREGGPLAPSRAWCESYNALEGAGRLHRSGRWRAFQGFALPLLSGTVGDGCSRRKNRLHFCCLSKPKMQLATAWAL